MAISFLEMARSALARGDARPFDASEEWHRENWHGDPAVNLPLADDWAHRAARGIVDELSDDHGAKLEDAFHLERIREDDRRAIVETMAAIIRQAWQEHAIKQAYENSPAGPALENDVGACAPRTGRQPERHET